MCFLSSILYMLGFLILYIFYASLQADTNKSERTKVLYKELLNQLWDPAPLVGELIPDIDKGEPRPARENSKKQIFFFETTNLEGGPLELNPREACAVESAASFHPDRDIYVVFTGPTTLVPSNPTDNKTRMSDVLTNNFKNVHFRSVILDELSKGSALVEFVRLKKYESSKFLRSHFSDLLRYSILWKYGGLFCDLDIVVMKNFDKLGENFVCKSSHNFIQSGTMHFSGTGIGHTAVEKCCEYLRDHFDGNRWAANGPEVVAAVIKKMCNTSDTSEMTTERCQGIQVMESKLFLPIQNHKYYWSNNKIISNQAMRMMEGAYTAHVYNHLIKDKIITRNSVCAYLRIAQKFCPIVYESFDTYF